MFSGMRLIERFKGDCWLKILILYLYGIMFSGMRLIERFKR